MIKLQSIERDNSRYLLVQFMFSKELSKINWKPNSKTIDSICYPNPNLFPILLLISEQSPAQVLHRLGVVESSMGFDSLLPAPVSTDSAGPGVNCPNPLVDDASKKIRKPYTITKSRQNWTDIEHDKFLEALHLFDRDWKKIEAFVGSKTAIQIRSHAQKYFLKVQKSGANEHVPPPRPKRKAAHPYPHKAPKNGGISQSASEDIVLRESYLWPTNGGLSTWTYNDVATQDDVRSSHNCSSSSTGETNNRQDLKQKTTGRVMPDFPKVYRFIGRMFDPNESNHLQNLKMMDPVDVETVVLLMKNLCANLKSPQFEDYKRVFSSYDEGTGKVASSGPFQVLSGSAIRSS